MGNKLAKKKIALHGHALGTVIYLTVFGTDDATILKKALELIDYYENLMTVNRPHSELMDVNASAGIEPVHVSDAVYHLTKLAVEKSQEHFGFNVAIGPLVKLWHIGFNDARFPSIDEISEKIALVNPDEISFSDIDFSIFLPQVGMELDLGAIAKGYIADRVTDLFSSQGITSAIINLGGNLRLVGPSPLHSNQKWHIGVRNPFIHSDDTILQVITDHSSVVTSGIAERHFEHNGRSYHHIIDSKTGYPFETKLASVTVFSDRSLEGEIETTRLFFANEIPQNYSYSALLIYQNKSVRLINLDQSQVHLTDSTYYFI
ncbi:FAD:protein FMN transferase [Lactococcus fujiensis]|uniref:FAD:protein FMN transferase n=1 Tax=Lactococcus fujiensis JCM 16395 TaxID=1291764 RepID=A0A2A5RPB1_9LACT|nr:FAD:protein FMN transferase [Lactococcus fujiensis]PCS01268.1 membrane-associated lipoprotein for thiamine biosynthesis [Lactococcus fujiensis JCM 16395]